MNTKEKMSPRLSGKQSDALLALLEKIPMSASGRNDPCVCGSGKKHKKCCLEKNKEASSVAQLSRESYHIKMDALTEKEAKHNFPFPSEEDDELLATLHHELHEHPEKIDSEDCGFFQKLYALRAKYPDIPVILNYMTGGYQLIGRQDKAKELIAETYNLFPDYLFAQAAQANIYLKEGCPEKALEVLKGAYTLKQLYPNRSVFHISEVRAFEQCMVSYFCEIKDVNQAEIHLQIMKDVLESDDPALIEAKSLVRWRKVAANFLNGMLRLSGRGNKK